MERFYDGIEKKFMQEEEMYNRWLKTFVAVADCGSFSKASDVVHLTSTAVMKQINSLEDELGVTLFWRTNHGLKITPAGEVIYKDAKFLFSYSAKAVSDAKAAMAAKRKTFKVGSSLLNPCKPFMDLWERFSSFFPGWSLEIVPFDDDSRGILGQIEGLGSRFDFIYGVCDSRRWMDRARFLHVADARQCVAVRRGHRLASKKVVGLEDLEGERVMMVRQGDSDVVDSIRAWMETDSRIEIEDTAQFYDMDVFNRCAQSDAVLLSIDVWKDVYPALVPIPLARDFPIPVGILYARNAGAEILHFISLVSGAMGKTVGDKG